MLPRSWRLRPATRRTRGRRSRSCGCDQLEDHVAILLRHARGARRWPAAGSSAATSVDEVAAIALGRCSSTIVVGPIARRRSMSSRMRRGVKPLFTILRSFVCSGGSMFSIIRRFWLEASGSMSSRSAVPVHDENSLRVAVHRDDVVVAGDAPEPAAVGRRVPVHRGLATQGGEHLVRARPPRSCPGRTRRRRARSTLPPRRRSRTGSRPVEHKGDGPPAATASKWNVF